MPQPRQFIVSSRHLLLNAVGWAFFSLGLVGVFLPLLPTTIFWILAAWCWLRSSPRMAFYILSHPRFGHPVARFLEKGEISRHGKKVAGLGIISSAALSMLLLKPPLAVVIICATFLLAVMGWIWNRPETANEHDLGAEAWVRDDLLILKGHTDNQAGKSGRLASSQHSA